MGQPDITSRLRELTRPTGEEDLLDVKYPQPRFGVPIWQALAVGCVVVVLLVAWMGMSNRTPDEPTVTGLPGEFPVATQPVSPSAEPPAEPDNEPDSLVVSVVGEVASPGLITLPTGARVADALAQANPHPHADTLSLNQAQRLEDGQQIVVGRTGGDPSFIQGAIVPGDPAAPDGAAPDSAGPGSSGKVNINTATASELQTLNGVGQVTADAIVAHRESIGSFSAIEQLLDVNGIGPAKFAQLEDQVTL